MQGEGELGEWLKQTGREVARAAGNELKSVAKDKAASYARSMIGEGLKEELGDAAGAVGKVAMEEAKKSPGKPRPKPVEASARPRATHAARGQPRPSFCASPTLWPSPPRALR